jgi:RIO kinase 1
MERLQQLIEEGVIDEVYNQLKTGKEAEVWLVSHRGAPVAAKIYKAREFRSFKNDAGYKEGRLVRNTRTQRAMDKGTKFGREAAEEAWKQAEADALFALHAAGVRVPKPELFYEGVLLMEVIGDAEGRVAPRLVDAQLAREEAEPMYRLLRGEIIKMLAADLIHGDLSEFNILLGANGPVIIDFPQVVTAAKNSRSEPYFRRDLGNLLRFFSSIDPGVSRHASDVDEIWREYVRRDLSPSFVPTGRVHHGQQRHPRAGGPQQQGGQGRDFRRGDGRSGGDPQPQGGRGRDRGEGRSDPQQHGGQGRDPRGAGEGQQQGGQGRDFGGAGGGRPRNPQQQAGQARDFRGAGGGRHGGPHGQGRDFRGAGGGRPGGLPQQGGQGQDFRGRQGGGGERPGGQHGGGGGTQRDFRGDSRAGSAQGDDRRRGPEVSYRGGGGDRQQPRGGGVERRRPRRRF